jgi:hypothetical protein
VIKAGGLVVAYTQLFSMHNLSTIIDLMKAHQKVKAPQPDSLPVSPSGDLNLDALDFSNFK